MFDAAFAMLYALRQSWRMCFSLLTLFNCENCWFFYVIYFTFSSELCVLYANFLSSISYYSVFSLLLELRKYFILNIKLPQHLFENFFLASTRWSCCISLLTLFSSGSYSSSIFFKVVRNVFFLCYLSLKVRPVLIGILMLRTVCSFLKWLLTLSFLLDDLWTVLLL